MGEEVVLGLLEEGGNELSLHESESGNSSAEQCRLVAAIRPESGSAEMEILVASDGTIQGNIEDRMAYLGVEQALEDQWELSVRILYQYASSVPSPMHCVGPPPKGK